MQYDVHALRKGSLILMVIVLLMKGGMYLLMRDDVKEFEKTAEEYHQDRLSGKMQLKPYDVGDMGLTEFEMKGWDKLYALRAIPEGFELGWISKDGDPPMKVIGSNGEMLVQYFRVYPRVKGKEKELYLYQSDFEKFNREQKYISPMEECVEGQEYTAVDGDQNALYWYEDGQLILLKGDLTKEELQALREELIYYEKVTTYAEDGTVEEEWVLASEE